MIDQKEGKIQLFGADRIFAVAGFQKEDGAIFRAACF